MEEDGHCHCHCNALVLALELIGLVYTAALVFFLASALEDHTFLPSSVQTALYSRLRVPGHSADTKEQKQLKTGSNFFRVTQGTITCRFNQYDGMAQPSPAETMVQGKGDSVHSSCVE